MSHQRLAFGGLFPTCLRIGRFLLAGGLTTLLATVAAAMLFPEGSAVGSTTNVGGRIWRWRIWSIGCTHYAAAIARADMNHPIEEEVKQEYALAMNDRYVGDTDNSSAPPEKPVPLADRAYISITTWGVPVRCLWGWQSDDFYGGRLVSGGNLTPFLSRPPTSPIVPFMPLWGGFVVNVLLYAAFWYTVVATARRAQLVRRRRRGLCEECAYDLRGLPAGRACPECGKSTHVAKSR